jgi:hypothetical protein
MKNYAFIFVFLYCCGANAGPHLCKEHVIPLSYFPEPKLCISSNLKLKISLYNTDVLIFRTDTVLIWHYLLYECSSYFYAALSYTFVLFLESSLHFVCPLWIDPFLFQLKENRKTLYSDTILSNNCLCAYILLGQIQIPSSLCYLWLLLGYNWRVNWVVPTRIT